MFVIFVAGSGSVVNLVSDYFFDSDLAKGIIAAIVPVVAALMSAFDLSRRANEHMVLRGKFFNLTARIDVNETDATAIAAWNQELHALYSEEPAEVYHALNAACHNSVAQVLNVSSSRMQTIRWYHLLLRHVFAFQPRYFPRMDSKTRA